MFLTGEWLRQRLSQLEADAHEATQGAIRLEEYIALPAFGQIMARFHTDSPLTLAQVDEWERQLRELAGDEFMIDFMGSVYRQLGVDYGRLEELIERLGKRFADELIEAGPFAQQIQADAEELLRRCALPETTPVWEIQIEENELSLLLMGRENRNLGTVPGDPTICLYEADGDQCTGLMRAAFAAKRLGVSLGHLLLDDMEG